MNNLSDIKRRIASVRQTRQITGAMETISVSKMRKALEIYESSREYFEELSAVAGDILSGGVIPEATGKPTVIVIASDKGLCGSFNHDVLRLADTVITDDAEIVCVGQTVAEHYADRSNVNRDFVGAAYSPDFGAARRIADHVYELFRSKNSPIKMVYTKMVSHAVWQPVSVSLFPPEKSVGAEKRACGFEFEPSPSEVLERFIPLYVGGSIYGAIVSSVAAEHSARRAAMSASTKNADEMISVLSVEYNRARQGMVTEQITEIIGSTQALAGQGDNQ